MTTVRIARALLCAAFAVGTGACSSTGSVSAVPTGGASLGPAQRERFAPRVEIKEFADLPSHSPSYTPTALTVGPDEAIWVTEANRSNASNPIVRVKLSGKRSRVYYYGSYSSTLSGIATGSDGALWMTNPFGTGCCGSIVRMTTAGSFTTFGASSGPSAITNDTRVSPGNGLWFLQSGGCCHIFAFVSRVTPQGAMTDYAAGMPYYTIINGIAMGPGGALWFTETPLENESGMTAIARITADGTITQFTEGLKKGAHPGAIAAGPDGALWFTDGTDASIGRITAQGVITSYKRGITKGEGLKGIAAGPDGAMWFTESIAGANSKIGRITMSGRITEYSNFNSDSEPTAIIQGPDHNMWFIEKATNRLARLRILQ
jgi:virginiamycin B lyase